MRREGLGHLGARSSARTGAAAEMRKRDVAAVLHLQSPPVLERLVAGWVGKARLGSLQGRIGLPRWPAPGRPLRPPKRPFNSAGRVDGIWWGDRVNPGSEVPADDELLLAALQIRFKLKGLSEQVATGVIKADGEEWTRRLTEWIEVLTHQDLHQTEPFRPMREIGSNVDVMFPRGGGWRHGEPQSWQLTVGEWRPLQQDGWDLAVAQANLQADPPLAHRLLRDARHEVNLDRRLEATLLLGSALEVALRPVVEWHQSALGQAIQARATLGNLVAFSRQNPSLLPLPPRLNAAATGPGFLQRRNGATHGAAVPDRDDVVRDSLEVHRVVGVLDPPPVHSGIPRRFHHP